MPAKNRVDDLRAQAREFAATEIIPVADHHDRTATFPWRIVNRAREVGLLNTIVPAKYGGPGFTAVEETVVAEELGYGCSAIWTGAMGINNLASIPFVLGASKKQKREWFGHMHEGATPALALTEPGGGSDVGAMTTVAQRVKGHYVINGEKRFISNTAVADFLVVFARTGEGNGGVSAFIVPKDSVGLSVVGSYEKMAHRCYDTSQLRFDDVVVSAAQRLGEEGDGFRLALGTFDLNRPIVAAVATGVARRALAEASSYAGARRAFGQPIEQFQAVGHKLADMAIGVEAARHLARNAARRHDAGKSNTIEASMAKAFATDIAFRSSVDAVQIFGAAGTMRHNVVEKLARDAKVLQIYEGTNEIQRNVIVRELGRRRASARADVVSGLGASPPPVAPAEPAPALFDAGTERRAA